MHLFHSFPKYNETIKINIINGKQFNERKYSKNLWPSGVVEIALDSSSRPEFEFSSLF